MTAVPPAIAALWAAVPDSNCKGLCQRSCGPVDASAAEKRLLGERGVELPTVREEDLLGWLVMGTAAKNAPTCPALVDGRCSVYDVRPLICRLYGSTEDLRCEHGCEPDEGFLPSEVAGDMIRRAGVVGAGSRAERRARRRR